MSEMAIDNPALSDHAPDSAPFMTSGLWCLVQLARFHQIAADQEPLRHRFGDTQGEIAGNQLIRAAKSLQIAAAFRPFNLARLDVRALPCLVEYHAGETSQYLILARMETHPETGECRVLIQVPNQPPKVLDATAFIETYQPQRLLFMRPKGVMAHLKKHFDISWFVPVFLKYKHLFRDVLIASFFLQILALITPIFFQVVMDKVLVHRGFSTLDVLAFGFLVVAIFETLLGVLRNYLFSHTTNRVDVELGAKLFDHLMALPLAYFESRQTGQTVARVRELENIRQFITGSALTLVIDLFFTFVFFGVMWWYSPTLTLVVAASIPLYIILSIVVTPILRARLDLKFQYGAKNQSFLVEAVSNAETLKSLSVEPKLQQQWEGQLANYVNAAFRTQNLGNIASGIAQLINKLVTLGILWFGAHLVMEGGLTVGQLVAFNMLAGRISGPILKLVQLWQDFQQMRLSVARLGDILNNPREPGFNPGRSALPQLAGFVSFRHVKFRYRADGPLILDDVSLEVKAGEIVGIVGSSGSGKSTLTKLVQRLYVPEAGQVMVDGVDLAMVDTAWLRQRIGVVLQENRLLNRSVRENIALSHPGVPMDEVVSAAKLAGAHEFILGLPEGYDTMIEEGGSNLSGGQRQRIAIARALISKPRILIFDEATSALDYESEKIIQDNMRAICQGRTVFIIAHRLSTVRLAHRIVVMEKGRILEEGSHQQLIEQKGRYAALLSMQNGVAA